ncbi:hypothetical protein ACC690_38290, partial [Rhizobium johnstonii]|uniref:hypothetical protein n=1 Tax=Rhizobium johnstonii TaxID=3019933 RepID=UPI003F9D8772
GFRVPGHHLTESLLFGAGVLMAADWLSLVVIYPYHVPVGLFAALFGKDGPHILQRSRAPAGELDRECPAVSTYIGLADHRLDCEG